MTSFGDRYNRVFRTRSQELNSRLRRRRSTCRLKAYNSETDNRSWIQNQNERRRHILELVNYYDPGKGLGNYIPFQALMEILTQMACKEENDIICDIDEVLAKSQSLMDANDELKSLATCLTQAGCDLKKENECLKDEIRRLLKEKDDLKKKLDDKEAEKEDGKEDGEGELKRRAKEEGKQTPEKRRDPDDINLKEDDEGEETSKEPDEEDKLKDKKKGAEKSKPDEKFDNVDFGERSLPYGAPLLGSKPEKSPDSIDETDPTKQKKGKKDAGRTKCDELQDEVDCLRQELKRLKDIECQLMEAENKIQMLMAEAECLQCCIQKQDKEACQLIQIIERQQCEVERTQMLECKLGEVCKQRDILKCQLERVCASKLNKNEMCSMIQQQNCLTEELNHLKTIECQKNEIVSERDLLACQLRNLQECVNAKDIEILKLCKKMAKQTQCICKLQEMLTCMESQGVSRKSNNSSWALKPSIQSSMACSDDELKCQIQELTDKNNQQGALILNQRKCLLEQHRYILEQEKIRNNLQNRIKMYCKKHTDLVCERNVLRSEIIFLTNRLKAYLKKIQLLEKSIEKFFEEKKVDPCQALVQLNNKKAYPSSYENSLVQACPSNDFDMYSETPTIDIDTICPSGMSMNPRSCLSPCKQKSNVTSDSSQFRQIILDQYRFDSGSRSDVCPSASSNFQLMMKDDYIPPRSSPSQSSQISADEYNAIHPNFLGLKDKLGPRPKCTPCTATRQKRNSKKDGFL